MKGLGLNVEPPKASLYVWAPVPTGFTAVAARLHGYTDDNVDIKLPGGTLSLTWDGKGDVFLEGPVELVYEGEWPE